MAVLIWTKPLLSAEIAFLSSTKPGFKNGLTKDGFKSGHTLALILSAYLLAIALVHLTPKEE